MAVKTLSDPSLAKHSRTEISAIQSPCKVMLEIYECSNLFFWLYRLRDGSEYLLSTPSRFMMKKWMMKIQANTGRKGSPCN